MKHHVAQARPPVRLLTSYSLLLTPQRHAQRRRGFTLTELLVVIGIIAVLLGILIPATVAARYRSRLVNCASNLRQIGSGVLQYANDNRGNYPPRDRMNPSIKASWLYSGNASSDQRAYLKNYIDFNRLYCPFVPRAIDWQNAANTGSVEYTYQLWWGVQNQGVYNDQNGNPQHELFAFGVGQPWSYKLIKYSVLACDSQYDWTAAGNDSGWVSEGQHPTTGTTADIHQDSTLYYSRWNNAAPRGPVDLNFLYNDGSVSTISRIPFNYWTPGTSTYRQDVIAIPAFFYNPGYSWVGPMPTGH